MSERTGRPCLTRPRSSRISYLIGWARRETGRLATRGGLRDSGLIHPALAGAGFLLSWSGVSRCPVHRGQARDIHRPLVSYESIAIVPAALVPAVGGPGGCFRAAALGSAARKSRRAASPKRLSTRTGCGRSGSRRQSTRAAGSQRVGQSRLVVGGRGGSLMAGVESFARWPTTVRQA